MSIRISATRNGNAVNNVIWLRPGDIVAFAAKEQDGVTAAGGTWAKEGGANLTSTGTGTAQVTLTWQRTEAGRYKFTPSPSDSTVPDAITVKVKRLWSSLETVRQVGHKFAMIGVLAVFAVAAYVMISGNFGFGSLSKTELAYTVRSYCFASATLVLFLLLVDLAAKLSSAGAKGLSALFLGVDLRTSTSKVQYLMWTFILGFVLAYLAARTSMTSTPFTCASATNDAKNCVPTQQWGAYLLLLGVPSGTAVAASGIVSYKVQNGTVQKVTNDAGATVSDVATNDAGSPDVVDIQYLLFNVIAALYVLAAFIGRGTLPEVPDILLGLTSTAAGTYVLNKSLQSNKPVITAVRPSTISPGDIVTISGANLFPDPAVDTVTVKLGGNVASGTRQGNTDTFTATAPAVMSADATVSVITSANIETDAYPVTLASLAVIGWAQPTLPSRKGQKDAQLAVPGLSVDPDPNPQVHVDSRVVAACALDIGTLKFDLPEVAADTVHVSVRWQGQESTPVSLALGQ